MIRQTVPFHLCLVSLLLLIGLQCSEAQNVTVSDALRANGFTHFLTLTSIAGIQRPSPDAKLTVFAPTNEAVDTWLKVMGLTWEEMKGRPGLAAAVVAYHVLPRVKGMSTAITNVKPLPTKADPVIGLTADNTYALKFYLDNGKITVEDVHNNTATIVKDKGDIDVGNTALHGIDKVLLSGDVYLSVDDFLAQHPDFKVMRETVNRLGLTQALGLNNRTLTVFAPTDAAFAAARPYTSKLTDKQLNDLLTYHIINGEYSLAADMKPGQPYETLYTGHNIKLKFTEVKRPLPQQKGTGQNSSTSPAVAVVGLNISVIPDGLMPAGEQLPHVSLANMYAAKLTIHGIDAVLRPNFDLKTAPTAKAAAVQNPKQGRRLLQYGSRRSSSNAMTVNSLAMTNTQSAIRAAVEGQTSVADAAAVGTFNARAAASRCWNCVTDMGWQRGFNG